MLQTMGNIHHIFGAKHSGYSFASFNLPHFTSVKIINITLRFYEHFSKWISLLKSPINRVGVCHLLRQSIPFHRWNNLWVSIIILPTIKLVYRLSLCTNLHSEINALLLYMCHVKQMFSHINVKETALTLEERS
jgi:hypothetical protein